MNIFVLSNRPDIAAQSMCNKHVVKMIVESCQLMSTAHHVLDGVQVNKLTSNGRKYTTYELDNSNLLKCTMINHPCTIWTRETNSNYNWLWLHTVTLLKEYTDRYGKIHKYQSLVDEHLVLCPKNIKRGTLTPFAQAMPEQYRNDNAVTAYRNYYIYEKNRFAKWPDGKIPEWYSKGVETINTIKQV